MATSLSFCAHQQVWPSIMPSNVVYGLQIFSLPPQFLFLAYPMEHKTTSGRQQTARRAIREWQDFDDAVKRKDLSRAIRFLLSVQEQEEMGNDLLIDRFEDSSSLSTSSMNTPLTTSPHREYVGVGWERDWEVLDTCLNEDDMKLVGSAYAFLKTRGFLPNFGKFRNIVLEGPREVTPMILKSLSGLEASKLSPKKWGVSGSSRAVLVAFLGGLSFLVYRGIDIRPNLAAILGLALVDSFFLGGCCVAQISTYWPPYKRRIFVHEAGHLLIAYLMGCPVRGVILEPIVAMQMGIQGQAGTQFWDEKIEAELAEGRLSSTAFDRYCMVLFAGIAAEALIYGEAEGGQLDENLFRHICLNLDPPLSLAQMTNQARWAVLQSYNLLKWHKYAHRSVVLAFQNGSSLSGIVKRIESSMSQQKNEAPTPLH